jgi:hypothetical protein
MFRPLLWLTERDHVGVMYYTVYILYLYTYAFCLKPATLCPKETLPLGVLAAAGYMDGGEEMHLHEWKDDKRREKKTGLGVCGR